MAESYDFSGWATYNDLLCTDGRTIRKDAFIDQDGETVPIVWQHKDDSIVNVIGHALLKNQPEGVRAYGKFNDTPMGQHAKEAVRNRDITHLSINANHVKQKAGNVLHGRIKEVSLVLAGANPGAFIDFPILTHADGTVEEIVDECDIFTGVPITTGDEIEHADEKKKEDKEEEKTDMADEKKAPETKNDERTVQDVLDTFNEEQRTVLNYIVGQVLAEAGVSDDEEDGEDAKHDDDGGEEFMHWNAFENDTADRGIELTHEDMTQIFEDARRCGSLRTAVEAFADSFEHSIDDIDILFPEVKEYNSGAPEFVKRQDAWVSRVWAGVHKSPFSRVKTTFADITEVEARAKGYIKGYQKLEEVFGLLKRSTTPQTVYKLQKLDRDDIIDITDFDVVSWIKGEMRMMLNEELSRAILIGDGRTPGAEDKINEENIRPIWTDDDFYTIHKTVTIAADASNYDISEGIIEATLRARKDYKGSGTPVAFFEPDMLTTMLLAKDGVGRRIYNSVADLASALRVTEIIEVPVFEGAVREDKQHNKFDLLGIVVNLNDYNVGADKGGEVNMFDDFDIDYNRYSYLIETRCSGALVRPYSAIVIETPHKGE